MELPQRVRQQGKGATADGVLDHTADESRRELETGAGRRPFDHLVQPCAVKRPDEQRLAQDVGEPAVLQHLAEELRSQRHQEMPWRVLRSQHRAQHVDHVRTVRRRRERDQLFGLVDEEQHPGRFAV